MPRSAATAGLAAAALCAAALLVAAPAPAHQGDPNLRSQVRSVTPKTAGLELSVLNHDDRFLLVNRSGREVVVEGYAGEPYARLAADGTVAVNANSEAVYLNRERDGQVAIPAGVDSRRPPRWLTISRTGRFEWHDHRMHYMGEGRPPQVADPEVAQEVFDYAIPLSVGGRPGAIAGTLRWVPSRQAALPLGAIFAFAGLVIGVCVAVVVIRRRRSPRGAPREAW